MVAEIPATNYLDPHNPNYSRMSWDFCLKPREPWSRSPKQLNHFEQGHLLFHLLREAAECRNRQEEEAFRKMKTM